jgi:hypothetical protein
MSNPLDYPFSKASCTVICSTIENNYSGFLISFVKWKVQKTCWSFAYYVGAFCLLYSLILCKKSSSTV